MIWYILATDLLQCHQNLFDTQDKDKFRSVGQGDPDGIIFWLVNFLLVVQVEGIGYEGVI